MQLIAYTYLRATLELVHTYLTAHWVSVMALSVTLGSFVVRIAVFLGFT